MLSFALSGIWIRLFAQWLFLIEGESRTEWTFVGITASTWRCCLGSFARSFYFFFHHALSVVHVKVSLSIKGLHPRRSRGRIHLSVKWIPFRRPTHPLLSNLAIRPHRHPVDPSIILHSLAVIGQYSICLGDFLERGSFDLASIVSIGMQGQCYLAVGLFHFVLSRRAGKVEEFVEVFGEVVERGGHLVLSWFDGVWLDA
mmetsp:Transcript_764/g.1564  ORF Transcript_764/g.1564 Transcript_764/m.1564 type:complete len:200 (+) Transcript_764:3-602(+)